MSHDDRIAEQLAWHANGTLAAVDRDEVEAHLADCADCRDLLQQLRGWVDAPLSCADDGMQHVHPALLVRFAEGDDGLDAENLATIEATLDRCSTCSDALSRLLEVDRQIEAEQRREARMSLGWSGRLVALWRQLESTLLQPVPAMGYLLALLLLSGFWFWGDRQTTDGNPVSGLRSLTLRAERSLRDAGGGQPPHEILAMPDELLQLELETALTAEDLAVAALQFEIELWEGDQPLPLEPTPAGGFRLRDGRVVATVVLRTNRIQRDVEYEIRLIARKPGDPLDGQALFRRGFVVRAP